MKQFVQLSILLVTYFSIAQQNSEAEKVLEKVISESKAVGAVAGYMKKDSIVWVGALGYADKENGILFSVTTKLRMGSIAKPMTAMAAMQLVEAGKLDLDVPIQTYIPNFPKHSKTQITARHLLSHTSGIDGYKDGKESNTKTQYTSLDLAMNLFKNRKLLFEPGTRYNYTTYGYTVLGVIIERASGMSYEDYMQTHIWDKAGMGNTGVEVFESGEKGKSVLYHSNKGKGKSKRATENNLSNRIPGGGFYTTVGDMLKFGKAVLNHKLVKKETLDVMREHHSLEKENNAYGFGWFLYNPKPNEGEIIGHPGAQIGCSSQLFLVPKTKSVAVVLTNTSRVEVGPATNDLLRLSLGKPILD